MTPNKEYDVGELIPYVQYSGKDRTIEEFSREDALAILLAHEVIFLNEYHWEESWPEEARRTTALAVNCNDTFIEPRANPLGFSRVGFSEHQPWCSM